MSDSGSSQGNPINWFSAHQRAILADLSYVELQLLERRCRKPMDAESQHVEDLQKEIEELKHTIRLLRAELEILKAMR